MASRKSPVATATKRILIFVLNFLLLVIIIQSGQAAEQIEQLTAEHLVMPGDTWSALAWRYNIAEDQLRRLNLHINRQWLPAIGRKILIPGSELPEAVNRGILLNPNFGGLYQLSLEYRQNPWMLALKNGVRHPKFPLLFRPIFIFEDSRLPRQLPYGFGTMEVMPIPAQPGQGLALRAENEAMNPVVASLATQQLQTFSTGKHLIGLLGTGAFFPTGDFALDIQIPGQPLWTQPYHFSPREWNFEEITLTGSAAEIDAESIRLERERLNSLWSHSTENPLWDSSFREPIEEYLQISSNYGARRSYNGGPYSSYHEGVDFSAYAGTPVYAPAAGQVSLAEVLYVRGGAVIIDHGFGVYTGLYHLSELLVQPGQIVSNGQIVGRVGTTGLSTGNHLHWDFLVSGIWVDASAWQQSSLACWILEGWERTCLE